MALSLETNDVIDIHTLHTRKKQSVNRPFNKEHQQVPNIFPVTTFQGSTGPSFFGETMSSIALVLFGFIVIYAIVIVVAAFADDFFRKNRS
ncbi:TPA: hypothetical protein ACWV6C_000031 [Salmonella enterica subsp. enterica serovar Muenchen]